MTFLLCQKNYHILIEYFAFSLPFPSWNVNYFK